MIVIRCKGVNNILNAPGGVCKASFNDDTKLLDRMKFDCFDFDSDWGITTREEILKNLNWDFDMIWNGMIQLQKLWTYGLRIEIVLKYYLSNNK
jgi:hypothetical protein